MSKPKIILWDIENAPNLHASLGGMLCFGYKVLGEKKTHCISNWDFPGWENRSIFDDKRLVKAAYDILTSADGQAYHYGSRHDLPYLNSLLRS